MENYEIYKKGLQKSQMFYKILNVLPNSKCFTKF